MPISIVCPSCGVKASAPDKAAGHKAKCPKCGSPVQVPQPKTAVPDWIREDEVENEAGALLAQADGPQEKAARRKEHTAASPFTCPYCQEEYNVPQASATDSVTCRNCQFSSPLRIPVKSEKNALSDHPQEVQTTAQHKSADDTPQHAERQAALQPCPDCGNMVSKKAEQCPRCGRPLRGRAAEARLTVGRVSVYGGFIYALVVNLDGNEIFRLGLGEKASCTVQPGTHILSARLGLGFLAMSGKKEITLEVGQHLQIEVNPAGGLFGTKMVFRECFFEGKYDYR